MTEACVILHNAAVGRWLCFSDPYQIISVSRPDEIVPALNQTETLVNTNRWHAAGFISYEASSAFDPALRTYAADDFPLLWFGLFPEPMEFALTDPDFRA